MKKSKIFHKAALTVIALIAMIELVGCATVIIPRELKDFVSHDLKVERRRVELWDTFRTRIVFRVNPITIHEARVSGRDLIQSSIKYYQRDAINDFINDTLVYEVRMDRNPDSKLQWWTVSDDMNMYLKGEISFEQFFERCRKEEYWVEPVE